MHLFPVIRRVVAGDPVQIDDAGMRLGAVAYERGRCRFQIDREAETLGDDRRPRDQRAGGVERVKRLIVEGGVPAAEPDLVEPHSRTDENREGAGADLGV